MAQGTERREGAPDSLAAAAAIEPKLAQAPQLQIPNSRVPDVMNSTSSNIARQISQWSGKALTEAVNRDHESSVLDGQMAYQQGLAMDQLEIPGDKWAMQGYRVMHAQTLSSTMLVAQEQMIASSQYEEDPDAFRATYVNRLNAQIADLDPQTAKMVRESMAEQMPTLVAQHTKAYMQNEEEKAYDALSASVNAMSKDPSAFGAMISNAVGGEGSASGGLSNDRRRGALVNGTVAAFNQGNPQAYQQLVASGAIDELPDAERQKLVAAKNAYEARVRQTYDEEFTAGQVQIDRDIAAGVYSGNTAALYDAQVKLYAKRGLTVSAAEAGAAYSGAIANQDIEDKTAYVNVQAAIGRKDWASVAAQTTQAVLMVESGGDQFAVGELITSGPNKGDRAQGGMQVMPKTLVDPGYGIRPSNGTMEDNVRVGEEYWAYMVKFFEGDVEAAAIAYNGGLGTAQRFIADGRSFSNLPDPEQSRGYARKVMEIVTGGDLYTTTTDRFSQATNEAESAAALRQELVDQEYLEFEAVYRQNMQPHEENLKAGNISGQDYLDLSQLERSMSNVSMTRAIAGREISMLSTASTNATKRAKAAADAAAKAAKEDAANEAKRLKAEEAAAAVEKLASFNDATDLLGLALKTSLEFDGLTEDGVIRAQEDYRLQVQRLAEDAGLSVKDTNLGQRMKDVSASIMGATKAAREQEANDTIIGQHWEDATMANAPQKLQDRAFAERRQQDKLEIDNLVSTGRMPPEMAARATDIREMEMWVAAGVVPKDVVDKTDLLLSRSPVDKDGVPRPETTKLLQMYAALKEEAPEVAETMMGEAGLVKARSILATGVDPLDPKQVEAAMINYADRVETDNNVLSTLDTEAGNAKASLEIEHAVSKFFKQEHFGKIEALFTPNMAMSEANEMLPSERKALFTPEVKDLLQQKIALRAEELYRAHGTASTTAEYARMAAEDVIGNSSIIAGSIVTMKDGFGIMEQAFGELAGDMAKPGAARELINNELRFMVANDPSLEPYFSEIQGREIQSGLPRLGGRIYNATIGKLPFASQITMPDATRADMWAADDRGLRPYEIHEVAGEQVYVQFLDAAGNKGKMIFIDLPAAGIRQYDAATDAYGVQWQAENAQHWQRSM